MNRARLAALAMIMLVPGAAAGPDIVPPALQNIPNLAIDYYDVDGLTPNQIRQSINAKRLVDPNDSQPVDAINSWHMEWRYSIAEDGKCLPATVAIVFSATVRLPRLTTLGRVSGPVRARWLRYYEALTRHEVGHLAYAHAHVRDVEAAMRAASCETLSNAGHAAITQISDYELEYDRITNHGLREGATFP